MIPISQRDVTLFFFLPYQCIIERYFVYIYAIYFPKHTRFSKMTQGSLCLRYRGVISNCVTPLILCD